jgi:linoleate 10R-lipoxygenase
MLYADEAISRSGDSKEHAKQRQVMAKSLYREKWHEDIKTFYEYITLKLLHEKSFTIAGQNFVDVTREYDYYQETCKVCANHHRSVGNLAHVHFAANVFSLPLKSQEHPKGVFTEHELYMAMAVIFTCIFFDLDPAKSFPLHIAANKLAKVMGKLVEANVKAVNLTGWISGIADAVQQKQHFLSDYGVHMVRRLLDSGLSAEDVAWSQILPTSIGS